MTDREKLIELMIEAKKADTEEIPFSEFLADFLIAYGVTVGGAKAPITRQCNYCKKDFIPSSRSDEIYCDSCKKLSYDTLKKDNETIREYRRIYKTQNARKQRNVKNKPYISEYFIHWAEFAKKKREDCINGIITLEEMKSAISGDEWMKGVKT